MTNGTSRGMRAQNVKERDSKFRCCCRWFAALGWLCACAMMHLGVPLRAEAAGAPATKAALTAGPDAGAQAVAERAIRRQFLADFAKKGVADKTALARSLLKHAIGATDEATKF